MSDINLSEYINFAHALAMQNRRRLEKYMDYDEVFSCVLEGMRLAHEKFDPEKDVKFKTYMALQAKWHLSDVFRRLQKRRVERASIDTWDDYAPAAFRTPPADPWCFEIRDALNRLPKRKRDMVVKRFFDDMQFKEIAAEYGISKQAVYMIIQGALKELALDLRDPVRLGHATSSTSNRGTTHGVRT